MWLMHPNGTLWNVDGKPSLEASLRARGAVTTEGPDRAAYLTSLAKTLTFKTIGEMSGNDLRETVKAAGITAPARANKETLVGLLTTWLEGRSHDSDS